MKPIESQRIYLRELTPDDAEHLYLLNSDPEVIKYTGDKPFASVEKARAFLEAYDHYRHYGFGRWAVVRKADHAFLGWCGLKYTKELDEFDIGFRFFRSYWNQGYATEAARACLHVGFLTFKMPKIVGRVMVANIGSSRVLEKTGLQYARPHDFEGRPGALYVLENLPAKREGVAA